MIQSISIETVLGKQKIDFQNNQNHKIVISINEIDLLKMDTLDIEIVFTVPIMQFRNHDYRWVDVKSNRIANSFSPKIIKLQNGYLIQANQNLGIWEVQKSNPNKLYWRFNPEFSKPITKYSFDNKKQVIQAKNSLSFPENLALLITQKNAIELSRSKIPFSAIACFTDHCDFDTDVNLKLQRAFFAKNKIKITKGFFLNHYSKRNNNASYQNQKEELDLWEKDGHEMAYHSLSQSIKSEQESFGDFETFSQVYQSPTWIDHGFQPYNFSLYQNFKLSNSDFERVLLKQKISTLWNYIDSGTASQGVINQLNTNHFTLNAFWKGTKNQNFSNRLQLMLKNSIFHYYADEKVIDNYKKTALTFKNIVYKKQFKLILKFFKNGLSLIKPLFFIFLFWYKHKNRPFKFAKFSPISFKFKIDEHYFTLFQTIEMLDFKNALSPKNIDLLISENGLFVAHTYFSAPMEYLKGRMFENESKINDVVCENFNYLSNKISDNLIWNPTVNELMIHLTIFENAIIDFDNNGDLYLKNSEIIKFRKIS